MPSISGFKLTSRCSEVTSLVQGLWFLIHQHHWILTRSPLRYLVAATSFGDLVVIVPQDQSLHQLQEFLDRVDARVGQPKAWLWACLVAKLVSPDPWGH